MYHLFLICLLQLFNINVNYAAPLKPEGIESHHPTDFINSIENVDEASQGRKVYDHFCGTCHNVKPDIELFAPKIQDLQDWEQRKTKSFAQLFQNVSEGINSMPARGGCFECSDALLEAAIRYMIPTNLMPQ